LGQSELPALSKENYIGVEIQIPIFDGLSRRSEIHQAQAQAEMKRQEMREAEQQVTIDIWSSVQTLQTDTENLRNTNMVMQSARDAYEASEERYRSGVGNMALLKTEWVIGILRDSFSLSNAEVEDGDGEDIRVGAWHQRPVVHRWAEVRAGEAFVERLYRL
jgi:hypothetical protein